MSTGSTKVGAPRWDLGPIYPGFDSDQYKADRKDLRTAIQRFSDLATNTERRSADPAAWLREAIGATNEAFALAENLEAYAYATYSTDTTNNRSMQELNGIEADAVPLKSAMVEFRNAIAAIEDELDRILEDNPDLSEYRFFLHESIAYQKRQMEPKLEDLAADLNRSGGDAWSRLQETLLATVSVDWSEGGSERKTIVELRNLAHSSDRKLREKAYRKELEAWKSVEIPVAYAINGVKGFTHTLNERRRFESTLERSIMQNRISQNSLDALTRVMEESLPVFRRYLKAKARLLDLDALAFYDLFAPVGKTEKTWSFEEARDYIVKQFGTFSEKLSSFAAEAFDNNWIDGESRAGKVGGAYCIGFPRAGTSRVLANFNGSFSSVSTLAHELGHAYHGRILRDETPIHQDYPMTLAETASIFCETIVYTRAIQEASDIEKTAIIEELLQDSTQVIVDILSRFKFENDLMERRKKSELSAEELSQMMIEAQKATYADGLDPNLLHPYMWAVKGHYYRPDQAFYNFPYAFGMLFGLGLFRLFEKEGPEFAKRYDELLRMTGKASAVEVTRSAGFDIESEDFWREGIDYLGSRVDEFEELAGK